jgi:hypothetical protein
VFASRRRPDARSAPGVRRRAGWVQALYESRFLASKNSGTPNVSHRAAAQDLFGCVSDHRICDIPVIGGEIKGVNEG